MRMKKRSGVRRNLLPQRTKMGVFPEASSGNAVECPIFRSGYFFCVSAPFEGLFLDAYAVPPPAQKSPVIRFGSGRVAVDFVGVVLAPVTEHDRLEGGVQRPPVKDVLWVGLYLTSCIHSFGCRDAMDSRFGRLTYWSN
ncbi:hypothetical protein CEXT_598251 [Caerostris extrusa]|uniref:Uncharacterized protein n=1 Tax=Caerostris extrusa TaxID=172846 RepID=A0AAV4Q5Z3_CAEEX|nr:hypothetical protein CEXT_598251 [Caerostris extrusa]